MTATGWIAEGPDAGAPALAVTERLLANRERGPGATLEIALARSRAAEAREAREAAAGVRDPDEVAAAMVNRGYSPGLVTGLILRRRDKEAELESENAKIAKGERVTERVRGMLERGQVAGLDAARMLDGDFGDAQRAAQLERQIARLDERIAEAQAMISPAQERDADPLEAASRRAHEVFVEVTRQRMADAQAGRPASPPFSSASRAGLSAADAAECTGPDCPVCAEGRRMDAARNSEGGTAPYAPGEVITTGYAEVYR